MRQQRQRDRQQYTGAAVNGDETVVRLLLDHNADANVKDSDGHTALYQASKNGQEAIVRLLLDHTVDVDANPTGTSECKVHLDKV